jgi:hypothetical protein
MKTYLTILLIIVASLSAACSTGFDDPKEVKDLRILAVAMNPPEIIYVLPFTPPSKIEAQVSFLVADPEHPDRPVDWILYGCAATIDDLNCQEANRYELAKGQDKPGIITAAVTLESELITESFVVDTYGGFFGAAVWVLGEIKPATGDSITFIKNIVVSPDYGLSREPNTNPEMVGILEGEEGEETELELEEDGLLHLEPGDELRLLVKMTEESRETHTLPSIDFKEELDIENLEDLDLEKIFSSIKGKELNEDLIYFFYSSIGELSSGSKSENKSIFSSNQDEPNDVSVMFTIPEDEPTGLGSLWFVVSDDFGGLTWQEVMISVD